MCLGSDAEQDAKGGYTRELNLVSGANTGEKSVQLVSLETKYQQTQHREGLVGGASQRRVPAIPPCAATSVLAKVRDPVTRGPSAHSVGRGEPGLAPPHIPALSLSGPDGRNGPAGRSRRTCARVSSRTQLGQTTGQVTIVCEQRQFLGVTPCVPALRRLDFGRLGLWHPPPPASP